MLLFELISPALNLSAFQKWFAGSKVVDKFRNPLLCFHGTHVNHEIKPTAYQHFGTFEAANDRISELYAIIKSNSHKQYDKSYSSTPAIYPVYLSIKNPLKLPDCGEWFEAEVVSSMYQQNLIDLETMTRFENGESTEDWTGLAIRLGYDGVRYINEHEDIGSISWYPFKDHQVWNAFANSHY